MARDLALDKLATEYKAGRGSLFLGAGVSFDAGLPNWKALLSELVTELPNVPGVDPELAPSCTRMIGTPTKWLATASILRKSLDTEFESYIRRRFADPTLTPTDVHFAAAALPWNYVLTTNYDDLLETAYSIQHKGAKRVDPLTYDRAGDIADYYYREDPFILYCHGRARTAPGKVILSESDYRSLIHLERGYRSILQTLFTTTTFLFVGSSFNDPDFHLLLSFLHSAFHRKTPPQYALVPESEREQAELSHWKNEFNVHMVPLPDHDYGKEVVAFLHELKARI